ncbi:MAG: serpin family protein [Bacillota bacterium]|nr:serpin family protein [Bacillota bacterium]
MKKLDELKDIIDANLEKLDIPQEAKQQLEDKVRPVRKRTFKRLGFAAVPIIAAVMVFILFFTGTPVNQPVVKVYASNLMEGITPREGEKVQLKEDFIRSTADFSIDLFKNSYTKGKNSLISPTSVYLALGVTANGAGGNTLKEFETVLGRYGLNMSDLNKYYYSVAKNLTQTENARLSIANSIWYRKDGLGVKKDFLQTNADYYGASAYQADFNAPETLKQINDWVKGKTEKHIDHIIDKIAPNDYMFLINAMYFEDEWKQPFAVDAIKPGDFKLTDGTTQKADFMHSSEMGYLKDKKAQGFIKPYKDEKYSFIALLPNKGVDIDSYVRSLTGDSFISLIKNKSNEKVEVALPRFEAEYEKKLDEPLKQMGLKECFTPGADFSPMVDGGGLYVEYVLQKTAINVNEKGTKAAAATVVAMTKSAFMIQGKEIVFDRPFVYAIIDNETNLPLFIGTMMNPAK